jgi:hypothetical protein
LRGLTVQALEERNPRVGSGPSHLGEADQADEQDADIVNEPRAFHRVRSATFSLLSASPIRYPRR